MMEMIEFERFFNEIKDQLYRFALKILRDPSAAEDVVQLVMIKTWKKLEYFDTVDNKKAWLLRVVKNQCIDWKRSKHNKTVDIENRPIVSFEIEFDEGNDNAKRLQMIRDEVNKLPEKQKMIMSLKDFEGYQYKEIAQIMDMNLDQVKVNLFRARQKIKRALR